MRSLKYILTVTLVFLCALNSMAKVEDYYISYDSFSNRFILHRTKNVNQEDSVRFRTVGVTAMPNKHFHETVKTYVFAAGQDARVIDQISQHFPEAEGTVDSYAYAYSLLNTRSYRMEVMDMYERKVLTSYTHSFSVNPTKYDCQYISNGEDLVYFTDNGTMSSGVASDKYYDSYCESSVDTWVPVYDNDGYKKVYSIDLYDFFNVALKGDNGQIARHLQNIGDKLYITIGFTQKEEDDGYQYIQVSDSYEGFDGTDPDGSVHDPSKSLYKACFILSYNPSGSVMTSPHKQFFPHRYNALDKASEKAAQLTRFSFDYDNAHLYQQKFKSDDFRASNAGALVVNPRALERIYVTFDAAGKDNDTWYFKDLFARLTFADNVKPTLLTSPHVVTGRYYRKSLTTIYLPFREIVRVTGTPTITTSWGTFTYASGDGTNVLAFSGTIDAPIGTVLSVSALNGTVKDVAGNSFTWSGTIPGLFNETIKESSTYEDLETDSQGNYLIQNKIDLYRLSRYQNDGSLPDGLSFIQTSDIVCDDEFIPIGTVSHPFTGNYDGGGHAIRGITVGSSSDSYVGLFGKVEGKSSRHVTIQNIRLSHSSFTGCQYVGGIVGSMEGDCTLKNCNVANSVTINTGTSSASNIGGIAGQCMDITYNQQAVIEGCYCAATIDHSASSNPTRLGGLVGALHKRFSNGSVTLMNCLYTGPSLDGGTQQNYWSPVVGYNYGTVINTCHTNSSVSGNSLARTITLSGNVDFEGDVVSYSVAGFQAYGTSALRYNNAYINCYKSTVTLKFTGNFASGMKVTYTVNGNDISGRQFTMPEQDVFITGSAAYSDDIIVYTTQATVMGKSRYVATFYQGNFYYRLPDGFQAYTAVFIDDDVVLKELKNDDNIIPPATAVIIIGDAESISLSKVTGASVAKPSDNIFMGSNNSITLSNGKVNNHVPYVLSISDGSLNFYKFTGSAIPAGKVFFLR